MELKKLIDELQFANALAEKRNTKLLLLLGKIIGELGKPAIEIKQIDLTNLESLIANIATPDFSDLKSSSKGIETAIKVLSKKLDVLKKEEVPKEWTFDVIRDSRELIKTIKAKAK